jgi:hypothetical protein
MPADLRDLLVKGRDLEKRTRVRPILLRLRVLASDEVTI